MKCFEVLAYLFESVPLLPYSYSHGDHTIMIFIINIHHRRRYQYHHPTSILLSGSDAETSPRDSGTRRSKSAESPENHPRMGQVLQTAVRRVLHPAVDWGDSLFLSLLNSGVYVGRSTRRQRMCIEYTDNHYMFNSINSPLHDSSAMTLSYESFARTLTRAERNSII